MIRPNDPTLDDVLVCEVNSAGPLDDLDWDIVRYRYTWSVGGRVLRDTVSAGLADFLPASLACEGCRGGMPRHAVRRPRGRNDDHRDGRDGRAVFR